MRKLTDREVEEWLCRSAKSEKSALRDVLLAIGEVEARQLHLKRGHGSLYSYLKNFGYDSGSAQRRIDAARLCRDVQGTLERICSGSLSFSQVEAIQRGIKMSSKTGAVPLTAKAELVSLVSVSPAAQANAVVADFFGFALPKRTVVREQGGGFVRVAITFRSDTWTIIEHCRNLLGHIVADGELSEVFHQVSHFYECKNDPGRDCSNSDAEVTLQHLYGALPDKVRRFVFQRDKVCQYTDEESGRQCGSKFRREVDHIIPRYEGGSNDPANLRLLCRAHNQFVSPADRYGKRKPGASPSP
jgi:5-methylcytosine-specific restriction endonuclease McrA